MIECLPSIQKQGTGRMFQAEKLIGFNVDDVPEELDPGSSQLHLLQWSNTRGPVSRVFKTITGLGIVAHACNAITPQDFKASQISQGYLQ